MCCLRRGWEEKIADAQLPLITEVLSVLDLCLAEGEVLRDGIDLARAQRNLEWAMADILSRAIHTPSARATELVQWIDDRRKAGIEITVVSTNYDTSAKSVAGSRSRCAIRRRGKSSSAHWRSSWRPRSRGARSRPSGIARLRGEGDGCRRDRLPRIVPSASPRRRVLPW